MQAEAAYPTDMMIEFDGRGFAPLAALLSFIADNGATEVDPGFGTNGGSWSAGCSVVIDGPDHE